MFEFTRYTEFAKTLREVPRRLAFAGALAWVVTAAGLTIFLFSVAVVASLTFASAGEPKTTSESLIFTATSLTPGGCAQLCEDVAFCSDIEELTVRPPIICRLRLDTEHPEFKAMAETCPGATEGALREEFVEDPGGPGAAPLGRWFIRCSQSSANMALIEPLKRRLVGSTYEGDQPDINGWEDLGGGKMVQSIWFHYYRREDGAFLVISNLALPRRPNASHLPFRIADILYVPPLEQDQQIAFDCRLHATKKKLAIVAVIQPDADQEDEWSRGVRQAWAISLDSGQFAHIEIKDIECVDESWGL